MKRSKNPTYFPRIRAKIRSIRLNKKAKLRRLKKRPSKKRKEEDTKENKINKKDEIIALP